MDLLHDLFSTTRRLIDGWATAAQQQACRNAMVAGTALAQARAQRANVEEFLAARIPGPRKAPPAEAEPAEAASTDSKPAPSVAHG
jgi:hypothetical protein